MHIARNGRKSISISHLSDSGDLKNETALNALHLQMNTFQLKYFVFIQRQRCA